MSLRYKETTDLILDGLVDNYTSPFDSELSLTSEDALQTGAIKYALQVAGQTSISKEALQALYPVGTIYMNDTLTTIPFDFGTWTAIDGKFLYGSSSDGGSSSVTLSSNNLPVFNRNVSGTVELSDATMTHTHDLVSFGHHTINSAVLTSVPYHSDHGVYSIGSNPFNYSATSGSELVYYGGYNKNSNLTSFHAAQVTINHNHTINSQTVSNSGNHKHTLTAANSSTNLTFNNQSFSVLPPYYSVKIWRRTA